MVSHSNWEEVVRLADLYFGRLLTIVKINTAPGGSSLANYVIPNLLSPIPVVPSFN